MRNIVVNYDPDSKNFKIYEDTTKTLIESPSVGEGFSNLNKFLLEIDKSGKSILDDPDIMYHFDSYTFNAMIKNNLALVKRLTDIPSEFKNSASKFGMPSVPRDINTKNKQEFSRGSKSLKMGRFTDTSFGKSYRKFGGRK